MRAFIHILVAGAMFGGAAAADLAEIKERGALRVAVANLTPFVIKGADGTFSGFEIDSTRALAEHLGVSVEYVERPFCELAEAIVEGEADIIASGYSNTPARRRILDFSLPYHDTEYYAVVEKGVAKQAETLRALNRPDVKIGYQRGGVSGDVAAGDFAGSDLKGYDSFAAIVEALGEGEIDGAVVFSPYDELARKIDGRRFVIPHEFPLTRTIEAFALQQGADDLREALNEWVIASDLKGYWKSLERKWFDPANAELGAPAPYACAGTVPVQ
ncbi:MAG: ABC transporter substrate-binding protein [Pseudomonadota bacterium]|nr:ABC transporter substrate-binding protein [Pseudomonadota bacterium]